MKTRLLIVVQKVYKYMPRTAFFAFLLLVYLFNLFSSVQYYLYETKELFSLLILSSSLFESLCFFGIGTFLWFYSTQKRTGHVSALLVIFSWSLGFCFASEPGARINNHLFSMISAFEAALGLVSLAVFLLYLPFISSYQNPRFRFILTFWQKIYLVAIAVSGISALSASLINYLLVLSFYDAIYSGSFVLGLSTMFVYAIFFRRRLSTSHNRQQAQQFNWIFGGFILGFACFFVFTAIPLIIKREYAFDSAFTTIPMVIFLGSLTYTLIRYQIFFTSYIRRTVITILRILFVVFWICVCFVVRHFIVQPTTIAVSLLFFIACLGTLITWVRAEWVADCLFFNDIRLARKLLQNTELRSAQLQIEDLANIITSIAKETLEIPQAALFVLNQTQGKYELRPALSDTPEDYVRGSLLHILQELKIVKPLQQSIKQSLSLLQLLDRRKGPHYVHTLLESDGESRVEGDQHEYAEYSSMLFVPFFVHGNRIGLLVLNGDKAYTAEDFEIVSLLVGRFASLLQTMRSAEQTFRHASLLEHFASTAGMPISTLLSIEGVARRYALTAFHATLARAEVWRCVAEERLERCVVVGLEPDLVVEERQLEEQDWFPYFVTSDAEERQQEFPPTAMGQQLQRTLPVANSLAWLPLLLSQKRMGVFVLIYPETHYFSAEEKAVLEIFAHQCAAAIHYAETIHTLQKAYRYQQEYQEKQDYILTQIIPEVMTQLSYPLMETAAYLERMQHSTNPQERSLIIKAAHQNIADVERAVNGLLVNIDQFQHEQRSMARPTL